jgi:hypothetical protein
VNTALCIVMIGIVWSTASYWLLTKGVALCASDGIQGTTRC